MIKEYDKTRRKWVSQMTDTEVKVLTQTVNKFNGWKLSDHALEEMRNDNITPYEVGAVLKLGKVCEANNVAAYDICVLMRRDIGTRSIAVVVSMVSGKVKTVYANDLYESERLPNMANYLWTANLEAIDEVNEDNLARLR
jgi:hypothetical protein